MTPLGLVLGGAALVGIGVGIGAHLAGRRVHNHRDLEYIAYLVSQIVEAERVERFTDQQLADADNPFRGQWVAPTPRAWAAFQEGHEKPWRN